MVQQHRVAQQGPQLGVDPQHAEVVDFGSNADAARSVSAVRPTETPLLGAFGDTDEHIRAGDGDWAADLDEEECEQEQAREPGFRASGDTHEHIEAGGAERVEVNGVTFTLGQINAMGDFAGSVEALYDLDRATLLALRDAMERKARDPDSVTSEDWTAILGEDYGDLALDNDAHFGTMAGSRGLMGTNVGTWRDHHGQALALAVEAFQTGDEALADQARVTDAFGTHFLTDTFSAGHLFAKASVMDRVDEALGGVDRAVLVGQVAREVYADDRAREVIRDYDITVAGLGHSITLAEWVALAEGADLYDSDLLHNSAVRGCHDTLGSSGVEVQNDVHGPWLMKGDHEMDEVSMEMAQRACAASAAAIEGALSTGRAVGAFHEVQGLVPRPTEDGRAAVAETLKRLTDPEGGLIPGLVEAIVSEIGSTMEGIAAEVPFVRKRAGEAAPPEQDEAPTRSYAPVGPYGPAPSYRR